jgi:hypothetical protein
MNHNNDLFPTFLHELSVGRQESMQFGGHEPPESAPAFDYTKVDGHRESNWIKREDDCNFISAMESQDGNPVHNTSSLQSSVAQSSSSIMVMLVPPLDMNTVPL